MKNIRKEIEKYQNQDIFAGKIPINMNKIESITSYEGFILTIIFYIVMFFYIIFNSPGDIVWQNNPTVTQSFINQENTSNINFTRGDFFFYFNIFDKDNKKIEDDTYLYFKIRLNRLYRSEDQKNNKNDPIYYPMKNCTKNDTKKLKENIKEKIIKDYLCPDLKGFEINGSSYDDFENYGQVLIYPCYHNNTNNHRKCKNESEISRFIDDEKLKLKIYYPVPIVKVTSKDEPMVYQMKEDYFYLGKNLDRYRYVNYNFDKIELKTDKNLFYSGERMEYVYNMKVVSQDIRKIDIEDPKIFSLDFRSSFLLTTYVRVYLKLFDCISTIGGFYPILYTIFEIVNSFFSQTTTIQYMISNIFVVNNPLDYKEKKNIKFDFSNFEGCNNIRRNKVKNNNNNNKLISKDNSHKKSMIDKSDILLNSNSNIFGADNSKNGSCLFDPKNNVSVIDLRKKKKNEKIPEIELSENRNIFNERKNSNSKNKINNEDNELSLNSNSNNNNCSIKEFYIQSLLNMKEDNKMKLTLDVKKAFNWMKCFGFSKDKTSLKNKINTLLEKFQSKIEDYFDYLNVIRTMDELELLKKLIFEKHELPILAVLRMPIIDLGKEFNIEKAKLNAKNYSNESITDDDMINGIEKILEPGKYKITSQNILRYLRDIYKEDQ